MLAFRFKIINKKEKLKKKKFNNQKKKFLKV